MRQTSVLIGSWQPFDQRNQLIMVRAVALCSLISSGGRSAPRAGFDCMYPYFMAAVKIELSPHFRFLRVCNALPSFAFWLRNVCTAST